MDGTRKHVSPSALDMYLRCGEQYRRRYIMGEKVPPGVALVKGQAVHRAAEVNYRQKIESHDDLPIDVLRDAAADHVDRAIAGEGLMLTADENRRGLAKVRGELMDRAVALTSEFSARVAPRVQPAMVETWVTIPLPQHPVDLMGRLDVADTEDRIHDLKAAGKRKTQDEIDRSDQLTFYDVAFTRITGRPVTGLVLDVLVDTKRPNVQTLTSTRTQVDRQVFLNRLNAMLDGVQSGIFAPAPLGSWCCSPRFCGYWWTCPYVNSERTAAAEAQEFDA